MRVLKSVGISLGALIALFCLVGAFLPAEYWVSRSIVINAAPEAIFPWVGDVSKHAAWSPWKAMDPTVVHTVSDPPTGEGAWYSWTSEHSGAGKLTFTKSDGRRRIEFHVEFGHQGEANGEYKLDPAGDGIRVTWDFYTDIGWHIPRRYAGLFMESFLGRSMEDGLARIKELVERAPGVAPTPPTEPESPPESPNPDDAPPNNP